MEMSQHYNKIKVREDNFDEKTCYHMIKSRVFFCKMDTGICCQAVELNSWNPNDRREPTPAFVLWSPKAYTVALTHTPACVHTVSNMCVPNNAGYTDSTD